MTGGVEQVDQLATILKGHHRGAHRDPALAFDLHEVARGAPSDLVALHSACGLDGTTIEQEFLREGGLPRIGVADDGERAPVFDLFLQIQLLELEPKELVVVEQVVEQFE